MPNAPRLHTDNAQATDTTVLHEHFGAADLLPLWIAEPNVASPPEVQAVLEGRARVGWYGYETRPGRIQDSFWSWMEARHGWTGEGLTTLVSPSVGTSLGVLIERLTDEGDGVILQPPVFTDFKPLVTSANRTVVRNPLTLTDEGYRMDLDGLQVAAAGPSTRLLVLCNPHNPVGRVWTREELVGVAEICEANDVLVVADEIHADLALPPNRFTPFGTAAHGTDVRWAATHGPIKTFGLAGVCDTLLVSHDEQVLAQFQDASNRLHLTRNNVFALAAFETAYRTGAGWLDGLLDLVTANVERLQTGLADGVDVVAPEGTYLAWLDLRGLGLEVPDLVRWIGTSGVALSPGHWFGREGAGFARMTVAAAATEIDEAIDRLNRAATTTRP